MRILHILLALSFATITLATNTLAAESPAPALTPVLEKALADGLERAFNTVEIPVGVTKASAEDKERLKSLEPQGLATIKEPGPEDDEGVVRVSPTKLALDHRDPTLSRRNRVVVRLGQVEIQRVIKNLPYTGKKLPQSSDHRFVLGSYKVVPTALAKAIDAKCDTKEHKFRAIIQVNPFSGKLAVIRADWGEPDEDGWKTATVE